MNRLFGNLPLAVKLLIASFLTLTSVVLLSWGLVIGDHYQDAQARLLTDASARADMLAYHSAPALAAGDREAAERVIASLRFAPAVLSAQLFDARGQPIAGYINAHSRVSAPPLGSGVSDGQLLHDDYLETYRAVMVRDDAIGVIAIATDLTQFRYDLAAFAIKASLIAAIALVIAYVATSRWHHGILGPIMRLTALTRRIFAEKRYELRATVEYRDEVGAVAAACNGLLDRISEREATLRRELAERTHAQRRLEELTHYDPVTKLPDRQYFSRQIERVLLESAESGTAGALMLIDVSNFKLVNDTLGHDAGDSLLLLLATRLTGSLRKSDTLCRLRGDEFALILEETNGEGQISAVAEKILSQVRQPFPLAEREVRVGVSIGIAVFPVDGKEPRALLQNAETAAHRAKTSGDNVYCFFSPDMLDRMQKQLDIEYELRQALERGELRLHFQPQVRLDDGRLRGLEALLRWQHPRRGLLLPGDFISFAEESNSLIGAIAHWTLDAACAQIADWRAAGLEAAPVSVNFSAAQLRDTTVAQKLGEILSRYKVPGELIELEITENQLMSEPNAGQVLERLRALGARIAVANFGTGYSSLGHLKELPITTLKIDRGFVHGVAESAKYAAVTRAVVSLAKEMGFDTVAEGVESSRQVEFLRAMGCQAYQGFCFSPAVPAEEAARMLASSTAQARPNVYAVK
ncbi:MAG TPA: EAL domain-containing protein [Burkholderiales bacterium]|nr:EAL domain-containing protein [Burkholderiales bacterium]